eukprot:TRINITY_DN61810_c0_g1_i1.p1 TRINITY_DN61810_c0_g1~~TRINITY_DN61810_c0_g1_i1.p1  ORF type:complete len:575 (+),score=49.16 TRINITY_DN61810_c0_g1_i1:25-1725(+)
MDPVSKEVWDSFIDGLEKTDLAQGCDGTRVEGASFVPALSPGFVEHVFEPSQKLGEVTVAQATASLSEFAALVGADADELMLIIGKATCAEHLVVQLVHCYTMESFFYRSLNHHLRKDADAVLRVIAPLVWHIMRGPRLKPFAGTIFRGINLDDSEQILYDPGLVFSWAAFSSCSKNENIAIRFAGGGGTVFVITASDEVGREALCDIEDISHFKHEAEVLMSPYTSLLVQDLRLADCTKHVICEVLSSAKQLTGIWDCDDDGIYYVSAAGPRIAWFAHARPGSRRTWAHVFFGSIEGQTISGTFGDVCVNKDRYAGSITLAADFSAMTMRLRGGRFGGQRWRRRRAFLLDEDRPELAHCASPQDAGIAGAWSGDDGMVYFITQYNHSIFWFAHAPSWSAAHVAMGDLEAGMHAGQSWIVQYQDIVLSTRFRYTGRLRIKLEPSGELQVEKLKGPFNTMRLSRLPEEGIPGGAMPPAADWTTESQCILRTWAIHHSLTAPLPKLRASTLSLCGVTVSMLGSTLTTYNGSSSQWKVKQRRFSSSTKLTTSFWTRMVAECGCGAMVST